MPDEVVDYIACQIRMPASKLGLYEEHDSRAGRGQHSEALAVSPAAPSWR
ncbi:hypothetical protein [Nonomuraea dietziae]